MQSRGRVAVGRETMQTLTGGAHGKRVGWGGAEKRLGSPQTITKGK